jgi:hypothetical protein
MFKEGDYIVRTWPSGYRTLAKVKNNLFYSLENYSLEGGVSKNEFYGDLDGFAGIPYILASKKEILQGFCDQIPKEFKIEIW